MIYITHKTALTFDVDKLKQDLQQAEKFEMHTHPLGYHDGNWKTLNLVYAGGHNAYNHTGQNGYGVGEPQATEVLKSCPYFQQVLAAFECKVLMARLSALPPDAKVLTHYDPVESADFGQLRIHIPIRTSNAVKFHLGFIPRHWKEGECWYGDFTYPHGIHNQSDITRVHLIIDLEMDTWSKKLLPENFDKYKNLRSKLRVQCKNLLWHLNKFRNR